MSRNKGFNTKLVIALTKEDDYYVAYCPALELSGYGKSEVEAKSSFETSLKIFLDETTKKGTLDKILLDLGWTLKKKPVVSFQPPNEADILTKYSNRKASFSQKNILIPVLA